MAQTETSLDTAITAANSGATVFTFANDITETAAPTPINSTDLTLDGAGYTLTGDGADAALIVTSGDSVTIENLTIANTAGAPGIVVGATGLVAIGDDGESKGPSVISAPIIGAGGVTISTGAAAEFNAADTYSGPTTVTGDLFLGANGSIADSSSVTVTGDLDISSAQTATGGVTAVAVTALLGSGEVDLGRNSLAVTESVTGTTFSGVIDDIKNGTVTSGGGLTVQAGGGALTLTGANTYTGSTKIYGDLALGAGGSIGDSSNVSLKASGAIFDVSATEGVTINELTGVAGTQVHLGGTNLVVDENATNASFSGVISDGGAQDAGSLEVGGTYTLTLNGVNTYSGGTTIDEGASVAVGPSGALGTGTLDVNGTLNLSAVTAGSVTVQDLHGGFDTDASLVLGANNLIDQTSTVHVFGGVISGTGSLQVGDATHTGGELRLYGAAETYSHSTIIYSQLFLRDGATLADTTNVSLKASGAVFDVSEGGDSGSYTDPYVDFSYYDENGDGSPPIYTDTFSGVSINELTGVAGTTVTVGNNTLLVNETTNASFSGTITGDGDSGFDAQDGVTLVVRGPATLSLAGDNTYYGDTVIKGHLDIVGGGSISNSYVADFGVFDISGALSSIPAATSDTVTIAGLSGLNANATVVLGANTLQLEATDFATYTSYYDDGDYVNHSGVFEGVISGTGGLTIGSGGEYDSYLELTNANTYTGATTVNEDSTLELDQGASLASTSIVDNGEIDIYQTNYTIGASLSGDGELDLYQSYSIATGYSNALATDTVSGVSTFTGEVYVDTGVTLEVVSGGSITGAEIYLGSGYTDDQTGAVLPGGAFNISSAGGGVTIASLESDDNGTDNGSVILGANTLTIAGYDINNVGPQDDKGYDFYGVVSGSGGLTIGADGDLELYGANTYTGSTIVYGDLYIGDGGSLATSNVSLKGTGYFDISDANGPVSINELTGVAGTEVYLGDNTLVVNETTAASFSGDIYSDEGSGGLTVDGSAYLTLLGENEYSGVTTINGYLSLATAPASQTPGSISSSSQVIDDGFLMLGAASTVNNLSGDGVLKMVTYGLTDNVTTAETFSGIIHGASALTVEGVTVAGNVLTLSGGSSDYSGGTTLTGATLEVSAAHAAGGGTITFADAVTSGDNSGAVLQIDNTALAGGGTATESFANTIAGLSSTDIIDLSGLSYSSAPGGSSVTLGTNELVITEGNVSVTLNISGLTAATDPSTIHLYEDSHGGTYLTIGASSLSTIDPTHYHP